VDEELNAPIETTDTPGTPGSHRAEAPVVAPVEVPIEVVPVAAPVLAVPAEPSDALVPAGPPAEVAVQPAEDEAVMTAEAAEVEPAEPRTDLVSAEQLCDYVERASFARTLGRKGYQQAEVDALLQRVAEALRAGEPVADLVRRTHFTQVRLEDGYDHTQVDDFLNAVVALDPHADRERPEPGRRGLVARIFG
jgi:DivIVA domain-containing protein